MIWEGGQRIRNARKKLPRGSILLSCLKEEKCQGKSSYLKGGGRRLEWCVSAKEENVEGQDKGQARGKRGSFSLGHFPATPLPRSEDEKGSHSLCVFL